MELKLLHEGRMEEMRMVDGLSGKVYIFIWDKKVGEYRYKPKNQEEIDDLFAQIGPDSMVYIAPIMGAGAAGPITPKPSIERTYYEDLPKNDLVAHAQQASLKVRASDDEITLKRLIEAFYTGAGWRAATAAARASEESVEEEPIQPKTRARK